MPRMELKNVAVLCACLALAACGGGGGGGSTGGGAVPKAVPTPTPWPISLVQSINGSTSYTLQSQPTAGNLLVAIALAGDQLGVRCNTAGGWTIISEFGVSFDDATSCYRVVAAGDGTALTPFTGIAANVAGEIWELKGQSPSQPIDVNAQSQGTATDSNAQAITVARAGDFMLAVGGENQINSGSVSSPFVVDFSCSACQPGDGLSEIAGHASGVPVGPQTVTFTYAASNTPHPVTVMLVSVAAGPN